MRKFSIRIWSNLNICYDHYLSSKFIEKRNTSNDFNEYYPLEYFSRRFDKPAVKWRSGTCVWKLDNEWHRVGKPACIWSNGCEYWENGKKIK